MVYDHARQADFLHRLPKADALSPDDRVEAMALAEKMSLLGTAFPIDTDTLPEEARSGVWNAALWSQRLEAADLGWLLWSPKPGLLNLIVSPPLRPPGNGSVLSRMPY